ncbi:MAG: phage holin family protein [Epulopiscium sp.]|nr:phage holin family protein [Candidatus Epulonipiscium sp.]
MADNRNNSSFGGLIIQFITTAIIVAIAAFLTPGFKIDGLWALILAAIVITLLDFVIRKVTGVDASPFGKGIVGFIVSAVILYLTKYIVTGFEISILGAIIGALVIGIVNAIVPGKAF